MIGRLCITQGRLQWLGSGHTFTLWPYWLKAERDNL